ncbi:MAG: OmpA family protein [Alphaproteobacteria bacterium]
MINIRTLALTVSALALVTSPGFAASGNHQGFYVGGGAGVTIPQDNEITSKTGVATHKLSFDPGWLVDGQVGYAFGNGLRTEVEVGYRRAKADSITNPNSNAALAAGGHYGVLNTMVNVIYDMPINWVLTPYIGAGVGYAHVWAKDLRTASSTTTLVNASDSTSGNFAYQAIGGFSYEIARHWQASLDYRYLATRKLDFGNMKSEYSSHNIIAGVKYYFNDPAVAAVPAMAAAAAAPAAIPMAPAVANTYMVFFDFNKSSLTPEAKNILAAVAADYKKGKAVRINVTGHADRSGTDKYNVGLSNKRASAVRAELDRLGVPAKEVLTRGAGEAQPLVATADGVREAQNRRAEIVFDTKK